MAVPANICIAWPSTVVSIPAGWSRETTLDSRYILGASTGADTDLSTNRGNATHTHTSPSHNPVQDPHTHQVGTSDVPSPIIVSGGGAGTSASDTHQHDPVNSNVTTATNTGVAITINANTSNDLPYTEVIWIKSDGTPTGMPSGSVAFFASDTLPSGWSRVYGDTYLKGATAAGNGGSTGGSATHTHTSPAHTHTQSSHAHTATSGIGTSVLGKGAGTQVVASGPHTHSVSLLTTTASNQAVTTTITAANHEPPYKKINSIQASALDLPTNLICLWLGTNAGVPSGWLRYTAMDGLFLKNALSAGQTGTTGGATSHTHTASDCQPIQDPHQHIITDNGSSGTTTAKNIGLNNLVADAHIHATWDQYATTATNQAVAVTIDACTAGAAYPLHRTVIFVQFQGSTPPVTVRLGGYTSYDINRFDTGSPDAQILPEAQKKIAQGDLRFVPR